MTNEELPLKAPTLEARIASYPSEGSRIRVTAGTVSIDGVSVYTGPAVSRFQKSFEFDRPVQLPPTIFIDSEVTYSQFATVLYAIGKLDTKSRTVAFMVEVRGDEFYSAGRFVAPRFSSAEERHNSPNLTAAFSNAGIRIVWGGSIVRNIPPCRPTFCYEETEPTLEQIARQYRENRDLSKMSLLAERIDRAPWDDLENFARRARMLSTSPAIVTADPDQPVAVVLHALKLLERLGFEVVAGIVIQ